MGTNTITWISLTAVFIILLGINLKIFFYKRTMHKIHLKTGISTSDIYGAVAPPYIIWLDTFTMLRWIAVAALFYYNWIAALICIAVGFILPIVLSEQDDYKNMLKMIRYCDRRMTNASVAMSNVIKSVLESEFGH